MGKYVRKEVVRAHDVHFLFSLRIVGSRGQKGVGASRFSISDHCEKAIPSGLFFCSLLFFSFQTLRVAFDKF